ncbi:hypothetical protein PL75_11650, partial [Neisseria arctica]
QARPLDLGAYMVRAPYTGATAIINPKGHVIALAPPNTAIVLEGEIEGYSAARRQRKICISYRVGMFLCFLSATLKA